MEEHRQCQVWGSLQEVSHHQFLEVATGQGVTVMKAVVVEEGWQPHHSWGEYSLEAYRSYERLVAV